VDALVTIEGAEPWSSPGVGEQGRVGVVVVHGFTGNPIATRPLGQRLAQEGYAVEVPLLPGHGTSHRDLARTRYGDWFGAVQRTAEHLRRACDRVILVGHSMGGTLSLDLACRRPHLVDGLVVINPQILNRPDVLAKLGPLLQHVLPYVPRGVAGLPTDDICRPGVHEGSYPIVSAKAGQSLLTELPRIRAQLPDLDQPLLVVWSTRDHSVPPENSRALVEMVGSDEVSTLELARSYHCPMLDYDAERLEQAVVDFVGKVGGT
jgi:carboxylesterase